VLLPVLAPLRIGVAHADEKLHKLVITAVAAIAEKLKRWFDFMIRGPIRLLVNNSWRRIHYAGWEYRCRLKHHPFVGVLINQVNIGFFLGEGKRELIISRFHFGAWSCCKKFGYKGF